jgi:predicted choloylglycine hydrolase
MRREATFRAIEAGDGGDDRWADPAREQWPRAARFLTPELLTREGELATRESFAQQMPELVPVLERLTAQLDEPGAGALLTSVGLRPFFAACTQAGVDGVLLRNYDLAPDECERVIFSTHFLRPVIGMSEGLWGLLDGMNDAGLAVSLTFGGRFVHGPGFSIVIVLRYLLETCETADEALAVLARIPIATARNLTLVDEKRALALHVGPDLPPTPLAEPFVANHQHLPAP